jgi:amino acid transporter
VAAQRSETNSPRPRSFACRSYAKTMFAMARSGLFPHFMGKSYGPNATPHLALIVGSVLAFLVSIICYFYPAVLLSAFQVL